MTTLTTLYPWRPVYWEPVGGTGERLTVGVLCRYGESTRAIRIIRDDVLDSLYGQSSTAARNLIDSALGMYSKAAQVSSVEALDMPIMGLFPGPVRATEAESLPDLLRTAALMYSSLSNLDKLDDSEDSESPAQESVNKRFLTEVRDQIQLLHPQLLKYFGRSAPLLDQGQKVKFGLLSDRAIIHFTVLHPVRQTVSVKDARARLWELARAQTYSSIKNAALITAIPRADDPTLGRTQLAAIQANRLEIEREADAVDMRCYAVTTVAAAVEKVLEIA